MSGKVIYLNDSSFEHDVLLIEEHRFFLVDFWAEWCNPCKVVSSFLEQIACEFYYKLIVGKLNIDENPVVTKKYGIRGIPTLLLFNNGQVVASKVGLLSKKQLQEFLNTNL